MLAVSSATSAALAHNIRITGSSTVNSEIEKLGISLGTSPASCVAIGFTAGSAMRGAIHEAKIGPASAAVGNPTRSAYAMVRPTSAW